MKVWILTEEYDAYDQFGEYFTAVFATKPHHTQLTHYGVPQNRLRHVQDGGGRLDGDATWYFLREVDVQDGAP